MFGRRLQNKAIMTTNVQEECKLSKRYSHVINLTDHFWKRFSTEYLDKVIPHRKSSQTVALS